MCSRRCARAGCRCSFVVPGRTCSGPVLSFVRALRQDGAACGWVHKHGREWESVDELLARGSLALPALVRARALLESALRKPGARSAARAAACLRGCAEALQDAADALELWAGWAKLFEERFGKGRGRG